jgi:hypothetical protein
MARVLGLGFLEYLFLSIAALAASAALYVGIDGHAGDSVTLPSLLVIPCSPWPSGPPRRGGWSG